jgi:tetratricopeptide (TPR) repeat protein
VAAVWSAAVFLVFLGAWLLAWPCGVLGQDKPALPEKSPDDPPLPKLSEMKVPEAAELLRGKPFDWIVLLNGDVLVVEPVSPRPNTLKSLQQQYEDLLKARPPGMSVEEHRQKLYDLRRIQLTLIDGGEEPDYQLETRFVDRIVYFEDLVLQRAAQLMDAGQLPAAYELLMYLDRRHRGWPEYQTHYHRFLLLDSQRLLDQGQTEAAFVQMERLSTLAPNYPQLYELIGAAAEKLAAAAFDAADFRRIRHFMARLDRRVKDHVVVRQWNEKLTQLASASVSEARSAASQGDHRAAVDLADRATRIWPTLPGLKELHQELTGRYQVVHAGVVDLPAPSIAPVAESAADERARLLCEIPLFEPDRVQDNVVRYRSAYIESWEPLDLGRELRFQLRPRRASWESRPVLTAGAIVDGILARAASSSAAGDDRWAANIRSVEAVSPWEWRLSLNRIPLRLEGWFRVPIPLPPDAAAYNPDLPAEVWTTPLHQRFRVTEQGEHRVVFQRTRPEAADVTVRHVAEIRETRYADWDRLLQGVNRGEVDFVPVVEWRDLADLQQDNRFFVQQYALPRTHLILINPHSVAARNGPLRRALQHALPREELLSIHILQNAGTNYGRLVNGPFPSVLYAYDKRLSPPPYSAGLAASLAATAKKELGGELPVLKLRAPADAVVARVLPEMLRHWKRAGLTVELLPPAADPGASWDLLYTTVRLTEPCVDFWTLLGLAGPTDWKTLQIYPHWLRESLLELERTVDWALAVRLLQRIQSEFLIEARWLPLWEVDEWLLARKRITGLPERPMQAYQYVERWTVQSWFPTEVP